MGNIYVIDPKQRDVTTSRFNGVKIISVELKAVLDRKMH